MTRATLGCVGHPQAAPRDSPAVNRHGTDQPAQPVRALWDDPIAPCAADQAAYRFLGAIRRGEPVRTQRAHAPQVSLRAAVRPGARRLTTRTQSRAAAGVHLAAAPGAVTPPGIDGLGASPRGRDVAPAAPGRSTAVSRGWLAAGSATLATTCGRGTCLPTRSSSGTTRSSRSCWSRTRACRGTRSSSGSRTAATFPNCPRTRRGTACEPVAQARRRAGA